MEENKHRRRRAISSSLGSVDFGDRPEKRILNVEDPREEFSEPSMSFGSDKNEQLPYRTFTSSSDFDEDLEKEIRQARQEQRHQRAPKEAVNRFELLTGIGRLTTEVEIEKVKFSLRSLKSKELRSVMEKASVASTNIGEAMLIRNYTLAFSIFKIDNNPIYSIIGSDSIEDKVDMVDDFEENLTSKLWNAYSEMLKDNYSDDKVLGDTPKKVIETIKK